MDGCFRRNKGFTVVQNEVLKDKSLSLKAKGLYSVIQCHVSIPDSVWRKSYFEKMVTDGRKSFNTAWKELKDKGYLKIHIIYVEGKLEREYELLMEAKEGAHTFYYDKSGNVTKTEGDVLLDESPESGSGSESFRHTPFGHVGKGDVGNGHVEKGDVGMGDVGKGHVQKGDDNNNTNITNTEVSNTNQYQYQNQQQEQYLDFSESEDEDQIRYANTQENIERYPMNFVKEYFNYNDLIAMKGDFKGYGDDDVDGVFEILYDVLNGKSREIWLKGQNWNREVVISRLMKLDCFDIIYAMQKYNDTTVKVHNHKQYMLSILYDAKLQHNFDIQNQVTHDMYGGGSD